PTLIAKSGMLNRDGDPSLAEAFKKELPQTLETIAQSLPVGTRMRVLFQDEGRFGSAAPAIYEIRCY
ncbi:MAG: hypothetical protein ACYCOX_07630, partial [Acidobacteriaceae bacterium]